MLVEKPKAFVASFYLPFGFEPSCKDVASSLHSKPFHRKKSFSRPRQFGGTAFPFYRRLTLQLVGKCVERAKEREEARTFRLVSASAFTRPYSVSAKQNGLLHKTTEKKNPGARGTALTPCCRSREAVSGRGRPYFSSMLGCFLALNWKRDQHVNSPPAALTPHKSLRVLCHALSFT